MPPPRSIADVGEFGFLARLLPRLPRGGGVVVGPGQDCAVVRVGARRMVLTVDALVEDVHFRAGWSSPRQLGRKSFLVNASDVAAMGARPRFALVSVGAPPTYPARDLAALQSGIVAAAREVGASVVGGNLTRAERLFVSVTVVADAPTRLITRQGAAVDDRVYVTGTLGDAAVGIRVLQGRMRAARGATAVRRYREPQPRLRAGRLLVGAGVVSAMIDVSDGLVQDLGHICEQSRVGAVVQSAAVPRSRAYRALMGDDDSLALRGGEDYELLFSVPPARVARLERLRARLGCPITHIGDIVAGRRVRVRAASGALRAVRAGGYDHFAGARN